jgi:hypothetical protein
MSCVCDRAPNVGTMLRYPIFKQTDSFQPWERPPNSDHLIAVMQQPIIEFGPDPGEREWRAIIIEREPDDILLFGLGVRLRRVLREAVGQTRHRLSGLSQPRQCGDEVLRMFVTGGPPVRGGGGIPQRIRVSSRSTLALRTTGAG